MEPLVVLFWGLAFLVWAIFAVLVGFVTVGAFILYCCWKDEKEEKIKLGKNFS